MKRGLYRETQPDVGNGNGVASSMRQVPPDYNSDTSERSNKISGEGCLGGWVSSLLGGGGEGQSLLTRAAATTTTTRNNDDPTALVAEELNKLSLKEREIVYEDLHGVSIVEDESNQELVNKRLHDMNVELEKIPRSKKVAYLLAMEEFGETGKTFCQDRSLHFMFLRADRWDSKKAATRFVGWMDWKLELFGREVLCHRHVTMDKLDKDSQTMLQSGRMQILPQRDTSGRTVMFDFLGRNSEFRASVKSLEQGFWYMLMATVEDDIQAQRMGIVYIIYTIGGTYSFTNEERKVFWDCSSMLPMLPVRINSVHYCFNNPKIGPMIRLIQTGVGTHVRARFRSHEGKHAEVHYSLMTYGIPANVLPVTTDGIITTTNIKKWHNRRKVRDSTLTNIVVGGGRENNFYGIDLPGRYDVLLGKGKAIQDHIGNRRLQELISIYFEEYDASRYGDKQLIAEKILVRLLPDPCSSSPVAASLPGQGLGVDDHTHMVRCDGAPRFLKKRNDGWWEAITHEEAIQKICHTFRGLRRTNSKKTSAMARSSMVRGSKEDMKLASSSSSSTTAGASGTTAATKRLKVETQDAVYPPEITMMEQSTPSSLLSSAPVGDSSNNAAAAAATTTLEDQGLDLNAFDWGI